MSQHLFVVAHDAGAAELISAYMRKNPDGYRFTCLALGPAQRIFERKGVEHLPVVSAVRTPAEVLSSIKNVDMVLTGTSWSTTVELDYIAAARALGIRSASYVDHWVNYPERFGFPTPHWQDRLPDEIWVGDTYAYDIATKAGCFPHIRLVPNAYFEEMKSEIARLASATPRLPHQRMRFLYISEPVSIGAMRRYGDARYYGFTENDVLEGVLDAIRELPAPSCDIVIRLHPADLPHTYDDVCKRFNGVLSLQVSTEPDIAKDVVAADVVVGMDSMALVTAVFAKKAVVSYIPSTKKQCSLPFVEIIRVLDSGTLYDQLAATIHIDR